MCFWIFIFFVFYSHIHWFSFLKYPSYISGSYFINRILRSYFLYSNTLYHTNLVYSKRHFYIYLLSCSHYSPSILCPIPNYWSCLFHLSSHSLPFSFLIGPRRVWGIFTKLLFFYFLYSFIFLLFSIIYYFILFSLLLFSIFYVNLLLIIYITSN